MEAWLSNMLYIWFLLSLVAVAMLFWIGVEIRKLRKTLAEGKSKDREVK
jgi:hypothetical protein